jgi:hypothetical protein
MGLKKIFLTCIVLSILIGSMSCVIRQEALVRPDGSGAVSFSFTVEPYFIDTAREMAELSSGGGLPEGNIFNLPKIRRDFAEKEEVTLRDIKSPGTGRLEGYFTFEDLGAVFSSQEELTEAGIISLTTSGENRIMRVTLNKENYDQISNLFPIVENPLFEMFGPQEGEDITEEEYEEMVALAFGDASSRGLTKSFIELKVTVEGTIVGQTGGRIQGKSVIFKVPLIKVLLLNEPLEYTIVFR